MSGSPVRSPLRRLLREAAEFGERHAEPELRWATQPYAAQADPPRAGAEPRDAAVLLFPGRRALRPGFAAPLQNLAPAQDLFRLASDQLGWDTWRLCISGTEAELERHGECAALLCALAALECLNAQRPSALERARAAAGLGAGELAALVFAGALPLSAALRLAAARDEAARAAHAARPAAALRLCLTAALCARLPALLREARKAAADADAVCAVAAYLGPGLREVAGDEAAVAWLARRCGGELRRGPGAALHTALAADAGAARAALAGAARAPRLPVVSCSDGRALRSARAVARAAERGGGEALRWEQALQTLYARPAGSGFPLTLALGEAALRADLRRVNARAYDASLHVPLSADAPVTAAEWTRFFDSL